jgi:hypothetical protein
MRYLRMVLSSNRVTWLAGVKDSVLPALPGRVVPMQLLAWLSWLSVYPFTWMGALSHAKTLTYL